MSGMNKKYAKLALGLVLFLVFSAAIYRASVFRISQNFAVVDEGKLYRSAQLTTEELADTIKKYGIKTVISLRGYPLQTRFYEQQDVALTRMKTDFVAIDMSDLYYPDEENLRRIFQVFEKGPFPILIHCRVGADRTGMVAALYQRAYMNKSLEEALEQLTFKYWHVPLFKPAMTGFVRKFKDAHWAMNDYRICAPEFSLYREESRDCKK
ncbi:MAG: hypothetical protein A2622_13210 [Bdellovibrionales bacterium RIFCSPHIGHO2_01_FULL_40_29]|nr:MAG: hypothetical protein A2622_13210 [Bdellovibrionales bacterium RIFCSPHIGHO2_01_FULL_40_29]OFZ33353.1 MAG: hypothetical protein A3D17_13675 [Bdellovibrionales bacterium RIFCSPHIGHO2_02_FULL_40_15]